MQTLATQGRAFQIVLSIHPNIAKYSTAGSGMGGHMEELKLRPTEEKKLWVAKS